MAIQPQDLEEGINDKAKTANKEKMDTYRGSEERDVEAIVIKNRNGRAWQTTALTYYAKFNYFEEYETFQGEKLAPLKEGEGQSWEELIHQEETPF